MPGVDDQRHVRKVRAQRLQPEEVVEAAPGADRRAPGHEHAAAGLQQPLGHHQVLGGVGKHLEALARRGCAPPR